MSNVLVCDFCDKMIDETSEVGYCPFRIELIVFQSEQRLFNGHAHRTCVPPKMMELVALIIPRIKRDDEDCETPQVSSGPPTPLAAAARTLRSEGAP